LPESLLESDEDESDPESLDAITLRGTISIRMRKTTTSFFIMAITTVR
jgi:hypothetical protein